MTTKLFLYFIGFSIIVSSDCVKKPPVYYLDNGGKTVAYHAHSKEEKETIESTILTMLNLPKRPKYIKNPLKKSTAKFLLNVYKLITQDETKHHISKRSIDTSFYLDFIQDELQNSDMIMALSVRNVRSLGTLKGKVFWIDIKKVTEVDQLLKAELRIYKSYGWNSSSISGGMCNNINLILKIVLLEKKNDRYYIYIKLF